MEYILDDPGSELIFQEILRKLRPLQNGEVSEAMTKRGLDYKLNLGASIVSLQQLAEHYRPNHLVALKLWNKQWRETMILATLIEDPMAVTANQMDFWVKSFPTVEMAEQAAMNLFPKSPLAYEKAAEYAMGKKTLMKITGLLMMGRLALTDKSGKDDKFEAFFEILPPLAKDPQLSLVFGRIFIQLAMRNVTLYNVAMMQLSILRTLDSPVARETAGRIAGELDSDEVRELVIRRSGNR
jgi:hypothetical protein